MKKITYLLLITILFVFNSCTEKVNGTLDLNYVAFERATFPFGVDLNGTNARDIKVYTTQTTGSDRAFSIAVNETGTTADAAAYVVPASVTVPANSNVGTFSVSVSDVNIGETGKALVLKFGATAGLFTGKDIKLNIAQVCPLNEVIFAITFDSYPDETSWKLFDSNGVEINSGGPYTSASAKKALTKAFCLENGTYTFTIYDAYGDGSGAYRLTYKGTNLISSTGAFGSSESTTFTVSM